MVLILLESKLLNLNLAMDSKVDLSAVEALNALSIAVAWLRTDQRHRCNALGMLQPVNAIQRGPRSRWIVFLLEFVCNASILRCMHDAPKLTS